MSLRKLVNAAAILVLAGTCYLGGVSRLTSGAYTPGFYAYQLSRAPNDNYYVPVLDLVFATFLFPRATRKPTALLLVALSGLGVWMAARKGLSPVPEIALVGIALAAFMTAPRTGV